MTSMRLEFRGAEAGARAEVQRWSQGPEICSLWAGSIQIHDQLQQIVIHAVLCGAAFEADK